MNSKKSEGEKISMILRHICSKYESVLKVREVPKMSLSGYTWLLPMYSV
jgi:hypothetical protein